MTYFEAQERQEEILALVRMMEYAAAIASKLEASKASSLIGAAQSALLSVLEAEFPTLTKAHLYGFASEPHGHC